MLLPDNMRPENSVYYLSAFIIKELNNYNRIEGLFYSLKSKYDMSYKTFCFCLDWLFLIKIAEINDNGEIIKCF